MKKVWMTGGMDRLMRAFEGECPLARNASDPTLADVLFLLDSSQTFGKEKFQSAIDLIAKTAEHFENLGPNGIQVWNKSLHK